MKRILAGYTPQLFAILRIVSGLMFALHGSQKLLGWPGPEPAMRGDATILAAGIIELVCGLLVAIGLLTGLAGFLASGEMAVAYWWKHFTPDKFWPTVNQGELAVVYCFLFLFIASHGAGIWSVDASRRK